MRRIKMVSAGVLAAALVAAAAPAAYAVSVNVAPSANLHPPGYSLSSRDAVRLATGTKAVRDAVREGAVLRYVRYDNSRTWYVEFDRHGVAVADVYISDRARRITHVYTGLAVLTPLARGEHGPTARTVHVILLVAGLLFLLPFVDLRRPARLLHLDLALLLAFGLHHFYFARGDLYAAEPLIYPVLLYLLARMLWITFRPKPVAGRLVPHLPLRALACGLVLVVAARVGINVFGGFGVLEGGYDSLWGASTIRHGFELYARSASPLNAYGPTTYLAYLPFELAFPLPGGVVRDALPGAHAATVAWDLLTIAGLVVLGRRMRPGRAGTLLGVAFAYAWSTFPWTVMVMVDSTNDGLVPAIGVWALVFATSAPARALLVGLAIAAKFFALPFAPAWARGPGEGWSARTIALYAAIVISVPAALIAHFLPHPGGIGQFLDLTVKAQTGRESQLSLWGLHPSLDWLKTVMTVLMVALGTALFFVPRERTRVTLAAMAGAMVIAEELSLEHWFYLYIAWFTAFVLVALLAQHATGEAGPYPARLPHELRLHRRTEEHPATRA